MEDYSELINLTRAARYIGVSYMTIHRWIKTGKVKVSRIGGAPYVPLGELIRIKEGRK